MCFHCDEQRKKKLFRRFNGALITETEQTLINFFVCEWKHLPNRNECYLRYLLPHIVKNDGLSIKIRWKFSQI